MRTAALRRRVDKLAAHQAEAGEAAFQRLVDLLEMDPDTQIFGQVVEDYVFQRKPDPEMQAVADAVWKRAWGELTPEEQTALACKYPDEPMTPQQRAYFQEEFVRMPQREP